MQNLAGGSVLILRSTVSGNSVQDEGGGLSLGGSASASPQVSILNSTITGNSALTAGGGIEAREALFFLANSIVADNTAPTAPDITYLLGSLGSFGYNLIGDNDGIATPFPAGTPNLSNDWVGTTMSPLDPDLAPLADEGGPTEIHLPNSGSPVLEVGSCPDQIADQRGYVGDSGQRPEGICDIGAVEGDAVDAEPIFLSNFESGSTHRWSETG